MSEIKFKQGGSWRDVDNVLFKHGGSWRQVSEVFFKQGGTWRQVWKYLSVTMPNITESNSAAGSCYSAFRISSDGDYYTGGGSGTGYAAATNDGTWFDAGDSTADVWVSVSNITQNSGSGGLTRDDISGARRNLGSGDYTIGVNSTTPAEFNDIDVTLQFHDAASGGNLLDTAVVSLIALEAT